MMNDLRGARREDGARACGKFPRHCYPDATRRFQHVQSWPPMPPGSSARESTRATPRVPAARSAGVFLTGRATTPRASRARSRSPPPHGGEEVASHRRARPSGVAGRQPTPLPDVPREEELTLANVDAFLASEAKRVLHPDPKCPAEDFGGADLLVDWPQQATATALRLFRPRRQDGGGAQRRDARRRGTRRRPGEARDARPERVGRVPLRRIPRACGR